MRLKSWTKNLKADNQNETLSDQAISYDLILELGLGWDLKGLPVKATKREKINKECGKVKHFVLLVFQHAIK